MDYLYLLNDQSSAAGQTSGGLPASENRKVIINSTEGSTHQRDSMIAQLHPGDTVYVPRPSGLGRSPRDARDALRRILSAGATLVTETNGTLVTPDMLPALLFEDAVTEEFKPILAHIRAEGGKPYGRPNALDDIEKEKARRAWMDPGTTRQDVAQQFGVSERTLYKLFGRKPPTRDRH